MSIVFLYYSKTGNTKMIIEAMYNELIGKYNDVHLFSINDLNPIEISNYDYIVFGSPCHHSRLTEKMNVYMKNIPHDASFKYIGVYTHATEMPTDAEKMKLFNEWAGLCESDFKSIASENKIYIDSFHVMGKASFFIEKFVKYKIIKDKEYWKDYLPRLKSSPTNDDYLNARRFISETIARIVKY